VAAAPEPDGLDRLHEALADADALGLDRRLELLRTVEASLSEALEGLDGL
jgi:hypothetical protein